MSNNVIAHIIGLDEINKKYLKKQLSPNIKIIDLDIVQQLVHNCSEITNKKKEWETITNQIIILRKQNNLAKKAGSKLDTLDIEIKKLMGKRLQIKNNLCSTWKDKMNHYIDERIQQIDDNSLVFIGFNIHPKDYRIKLPILLKQQPKKYAYKNKIICDTSPNEFASNQIEHYLTNYSDRIIRGIFPLNLLKHKYLAEKFDKFTTYYQKIGYSVVPLSEIASMINYLDVERTRLINMSSKYLFVATNFKSGDVLLATAKNPIIGFSSVVEAKNHLVDKKIANSIMYLYKVPIENFQLVEDKFIATSTVYPINEESIILT